MLEKSWQLKRRMTGSCFPQCDALWPDVKPNIVCIVWMEQFKLGGKKIEFRPLGRKRSRLQEFLGVIF